MHKENGITLIALVVTIIVLIILATVSINAVFSDNGIIKRAEIAKQEMKLSEYEERIKIIVLDEHTGKMIDETKHSQKLKDLVQDRLLKEEWVKTTEDIPGEDYQIKIVTKDKYILIIEISEDGTVEFVEKGLDDGEPYPDIKLTKIPLEGTENEKQQIKVEAEIEVKGKTKEVTKVRLIKPESKWEEKEYVEGGVIFEVEGRGSYTFEAISNVGKSTRKTIEVNIIEPESDITIVSEPVTPRNTESTGIKNGVKTGTILVEIDYKDTNYQHQYKKETESSWTTVSQEKVSIEVTENMAIYARYNDGINGLKTVTYNIQNVDNVAPTFNESDIEVTVNGAEITATVTTEARDTAEDSKGNASASGTEGIARYEYSINGKSYQESNTFTITSPDMNKVYVKAIDKAGNETIASKDIEVKDIPSVTMLSVDNGNVNIFDNVTTTFTAKIVGMNYTYQWYYNDTALGSISEELSGERTITYNVPTNTMNTDNYAGGTYKCVVTNNVGSAEATANQTVTYTVSDATQMKNFATRVNSQGITFEGKTITQTADIDLSSVCSESLGSWVPIQTFAGTFNGNNKTISNLYINTSTNFNGLFGKNIGIIQNIKVQNINMNVIAAINGTIVGLNYGTVTNCASIGGQIKNTVEEESRTGGIAGGNAGTIKNCYNTTNIIINGNGMHNGGIVGFNAWDTNISVVEDCYNIGNITGGYVTGGVVGTNYTSGNVKNCYNIGNIISNNQYNGGIVGWNFNLITNSYYLVGSSDYGIGAINSTEESKTGTYMKSSEFVNLLGNDNWKIVEGKNNGYPILSWQEGTGITVENYDIYYNGVTSKELVVNEYTNWDTKGTVTFENDHINMDTSNSSRALNAIWAKDEIDLTKYNSIVVKKTNISLYRVYFVTGNLGVVNKGEIAFSFQTKNAINLGNDTYACDIGAETVSGWLSIDAFNTNNDGDIYEIYLTTKTVEQLEKEYEK